MTVRRQSRGRRPPSGVGAEARDGRRDKGLPTARVAHHRRATCTLPLPAAEITFDITDVEGEVDVLLEAQLPETVA